MSLNGTLSSKRLLALLSLSLGLLVALPAIAWGTPFSEPAPVVHGTVVDNSWSLPVVGATVELIPAEQAPEAAAVAVGLTDAAGSFEVTAPAGSYRLRIAAAGHSPYEAIVSLQDSEATAHHAVLQRAGASFAGRIEAFRSWQVPARAEIGVYRVDAEGLSYVTTAMGDDHGAYEVWVPPGTYVLELKADGFYDATTTAIAFAGGPTVNQTLYMYVRPLAWVDCYPTPMALSDVDAGTRLDISLTNEIGAPIANARVFLESRAPTEPVWSRIATVTTGATGTAVVRAFPEADVFYRVVFGGNGEYGGAVSTQYEVTVPERTRWLVSTYPSPVTLPNQSIALRGKLLVGPAPGTPWQTGGMDEPISVDAFVGGKWTTIGDNLWTSASGDVSVSVRPTTKTLYRYRWFGVPGGYEPKTSATMTVIPMAKVTPAVGRRYGLRSYMLYGSLSPRHTAGSYPVRVYLAKYAGNGKWRSYGYVKAKAYNSGGITRFQINRRFPSTGRWRLQAVHPGDSGHITSRSSYSYVTVR